MKTNPLGETDGVLVRTTQNGAILDLGIALFNTLTLCRPSDAWEKAISCLEETQRRCLSQNLLEEKSKNEVCRIIHCLRNWGRKAVRAAYMEHSVSRNELPRMPPDWG